MKKYKIYIKTGKIEKLDHQFDITELENALDFLIIEQQIIELIVIEHNFQNDCDFPFFVYHGNLEKYENFKKELHTVLLIEESKKANKKVKK